MAEISCFCTGPVLKVVPAPPLTPPLLHVERNVLPPFVFTSRPLPAIHERDTQRISLQVSNPFETSAKNAADGRFTVRLKQAMVAEHPSVASLALPVGRRASVAAARRRASSVHVSSVASKLVPSVASTGSGGGKSKQSREGPRGRAGPQGSKDVTGTVEETNVRGSVHAALCLLECVPLLMAVAFVVDVVCTRTCTAA